MQQLVSQLTELGVELSVVNGKLKARMPWQKDGVPAEAMDVMRQAKAVQSELLNALTWDEDRAFGLFDAAVDRARKRYLPGVYKSVDIESLNSAGKVFAAGIHAQNMQLVMAAVQEWDVIVERCTNDSN